MRRKRDGRLSSGLVVLLIAAVLLGLIALGLSLFLFTGCAAPAPKEAPAHVFVFLGDGMGINQVAATRYYQKERDDLGGNGIFGVSFDSFEQIGLMSTHSRSAVTDSAAAITALLGGYKAENGTINFDVSSQSGSRPFAALAREAGYAVGVVTAASVDHATPAGVYASADNRYDYDAIAPQGLAPAYLSFLGGGGFRAGDPDGLIALARLNGFEVAQGAEEVRGIEAGEAPLLALAPGPVGAADMMYEIDRLRAAQYGGEDLSFREMVQAAVLRLEGQEKFFLFCEAARIDFACASQDALTAMYEVQALDDGVAVALEYYRAHPDDTLIVVLSDHETGGLRIKTGADFSAFQGQIASYERFYSIMRPLYKEQTPFAQALEQAEHYFGVTVSRLEQEEKKEMEEAYLESLALPEGEDPFTQMLLARQAERTRVSFETTSHTAAPVAVYATGVKAETFSGLYDNTDIYAKLREIMGVR